MLKPVTRTFKQRSHGIYINYTQKCFIVDTLPRHLLPKSPKIKAEELSAKAILNPMYQERADPNPYVHFNKLNRREEYELPLAIRWSNILKISKEKIAKILEDHPELCHIRNPETDIKNISDYLTETFGGESYMRTMIMREPLILDSDILYLQNQINQIVECLSDHVIDDRNNNDNKSERIEFVLDMIRRQPTILTQNIDGDVIPRILFLKQLLNPYQLTEVLLNVSSVIIMAFHRLIRIVFIQQKSKNLWNDNKQKQKLMEISRNMQLTKINLKDLNIDYKNLELIEKQIDNDGIMLSEILRFQPTIMVKVFNDYNYWLHDQIKTNYYYHPFLAEHDMLKLNDSSFYSQPILNLIDNDDNNDDHQLLKGKVIELDKEQSMRLIKKQEKQKKYQQQQQIKEIRKQKTIRQLEILVGDVYKANIFKQSIF